jgi:hypothetical protein
MLAGHHHYVTIGENINRADCAIPTCGLPWTTTPQPVVLDYWRPESTSPDGPITTIASWRGAYGPVSFQGKTYGLRVHEFRKFAPVAHLAGQRFEIALDIHPADQADITLLESNGWAIVSPRAVAADPWAYQRYIAGSRAEFMVAKNMYVESRSGWFSDRSICYLAAGKPVVAQDTGLEGLRSHGNKGLVMFNSLEEAVAGVEHVCGDYAAHSRAARELAVDCFDSNKVLSRLIDSIGV